MTLNPAKVGLAVQSGLSVVCATCSLYWEARDRGLPEPQCLAVDGCGSPLRGDDFHEYRGPITEFSQWCFVCGAEARFGIRVQQRPRIVGACKEHVALTAQLKAINGPEPTVVVNTGSEIITPDRLLPRTRKTLAQAIFEVEEHYAKKERG